MVSTEEFLDKYHIDLNDQQIRAVGQTEGPVLLLAVPGSGKTTVLIARLGYMIACRKIPPEKILTLTYTTAAARDMKDRFRQAFGEELADMVEFRTINGICAKILYHFAKVTGKAESLFQLATDEKETARILSGIYNAVEGGFPTDSDLMAIRTGITYIKNMMLNDEEIREYSGKQDMDLARIYGLYQETMRREHLMDYDDQMIYAFRLLKNVPELLRYYEEQYPYICVDEAQDTSKIQHAIIALLAKRNRNIFMVGDEDQSIYGFRAAYPDALLNFEKTYENAKVFLMEKNYRSDKKIVDLADRFIQQNMLRHKKIMEAVRPEGRDVHAIEVRSRDSQYDYLLNVARSCTSETAVLYRDNECMLPLVDLFLREEIPFRMRSADITFFSNRVVMDIRNIIRFAFEPDNTEVFLQIYYKVKTYLRKTEAAYICRIAKERKLDVLEAALSFGGLDGRKNRNLRVFQNSLSRMRKENAYMAVNRIMSEMGYADYMERMNLSEGKVDILRAIASKISNPLSLESRLNELQEYIRAADPFVKSNLILSTIHASKGLEYDQVYIMDAFDGIFPENAPKTGRKTRTVDAEYEEERRLFYVAMTRAKNSLHLFYMKSGSAFYRELFGQPENEKVSSKKSRKQASFPTATVYSSKEKVLDEDAYRSYREKLTAGAEVIHKNFGRGVILGTEGETVKVQFGDVVKTLSMRWTFQNGLIEPAEY